MPALFEELQGLSANAGANIFIIPPYFAYIAKAFATLEGIGLAVDPNYSILNDTLPYISRRIVTDPSPRTAGALETFVFGGEKDNKQARVIDAGRVGTLVASEIIRCLLYADDICLMVDSAADLQRILGVCQKYADVSSFQFSMEKSQVIIFSDYEHDRYKNEFRLMGVLMKSGPRIQILGLILHERKPRPQFGAWPRPCMWA